MAQIFISHSKRDEDIKNLFLRAFRGTGVTDVYREYENAPPSGVKAEDIARDIEFSSAVFVLLSETVRRGISISVVNKAGARLLIV